MNCTRNLNAHARKGDVSGEGRAEGMISNGEHGADMLMFTPERVLEGFDEKGMSGGRRSYVLQSGLRVGWSG
ncbi:hypothetical protein J6590_048136 [Homalodisca vitripennis]|nr:hypothetical protein J6590_048136 [Homalodisca vitripennis]